MKIPVLHASRRPARALTALACLLVLTLAGAFSAAAAARPARGHAGSCPAHRSRHASAKHCAGKHSHKPKPPAHKAKKPAHKPAPAPVLTPAKCEDGTSPARSAAGAYSCEDGSEPVCEDGSDPVRAGAASAPMCRPPHDEERECGVGANGECQLEFACEDAEEAGDAPQGCEYGSAFEEGEPES